MRKNDNLTYFNMSILCIWFQVINEVKVTHQGEGHIKIKVKISSTFPILCQILFLCVWLQLINKVKFIIQGHIKVKVKYLHPFKFYVMHTFYKKVVCIRLNAFLFNLNLVKPKAMEHHSLSIAKMHSEISFLTPRSTRISKRHQLTIDWW